MGGNSSTNDDKDRQEKNEQLADRLFAYPLSSEIVPPAKSWSASPRAGKRFREDFIDGPLEQKWQRRK
ncbi:unnamed protein product [Rotaria socialis]|uniref:Uncharacterized protein n=1 Tax=Rotaria socialis TaxID=392032 RepID=A0A819WIJ5_9BILA|nr:unnamed protein product [Rotaria socialis]CAF3467718.1 unnamed protein product [Rotaria socialis]CAF3547636.1 unnamed protein product [Rotaria socialis]CAF3768651.1 unnamed protein product [Rotaria socialis]CAF4123376.1 unnamed protein product [Rotaria socialis]